MEGKNKKFSVMPGASRKGLLKDFNNWKKAERTHVCTGM